MMDIAAISMGLSQMNLQQQASISVMKMAMDTAKGQTVDLVNMLETCNMVNTDVKIMERSITPHLGANIDISI